MIKKNVLFWLFILACSKTIKAASPVSIVPRVESNYTYTNATLSISSFTISTFTAISGLSGRYREITIPNTLSGAGTFYYRLDGDNSTITTTGIPVLPGETEIIETSGLVYIQLEPLISSKTLRYVIKQK